MRRGARSAAGLFCGLNFSRVLPIEIWRAFDRVRIWVLVIKAKGLAKFASPILWFTMVDLFVGGESFREGVVDFGEELGVVGVDGGGQTAQPVEETAPLICREGEGFFLVA